MAAPGRCRKHCGAALRRRACRGVRASSTQHRVRASGTRRLLQTFELHLERRNTEALQRRAQGFGLRPTCRLPVDRPRGEERGGALTSGHAGWEGCAGVGCRRGRGGGRGGGGMGAGAAVANRAGGGARRWRASGGDPCRPPAWAGPLAQVRPRGAAGGGQQLVAGTAQPSHCRATDSGRPSGHLGTPEWVSHSLQHVPMGVPDVERPGLGSASGFGALGHSPCHRAEWRGTSVRHPR